MKKFKRLKAEDNVDKNAAESVESGTAQQNFLMTEKFNSPAGASNDVAASFHLTC